MDNAIYKYPRLYISDPLSVGEKIKFTTDDHHYLTNVLRKSAGDQLRLFNGRDGEFLAQLENVSKKSSEAKIKLLLKSQPQADRHVRLYFAPIKKDRLPFLIEKAVELGVTDFHPVLTTRTENRKYREDKIKSYIKEAAEQCERLDFPILHESLSLTDCPFESPTYAAIEREDNPLFSPQEKTLGILIGPEGGWTGDEIDYLSTLSHITPVSLGSNILRAETAALFMLSRIEG